mgnify:CR=1 FL=1
MRASLPSNIGRFGGMTRSASLPVIEKGRIVLDSVSAAMIPLCMAQHVAIELELRAKVCLLEDTSVITREALTL